MPSPKILSSRIGLGCVTFGREIDETASFALMDHALARGTTFFDTAAAYSEGLSETIVGAWLSSRPSAARTVTVATKIRPPFDPSTLYDSVRRSLERLRLGSVHVLFLHRWDLSAEAPGTVLALSELFGTGEVAALGVSNFTAPQLSSFIATLERYGGPRIRFLQNNHNLAVHDVDDDILQLSLRHGIEIITYSPLGAGYLTGKHRNGVVEGGTRFAIIPGHADVYFNERSFKRLARLESVAARSGYSQTHLALAWALHQPGIGTVLVGGRTPAHLDQAWAALQLNDAALFTELGSD